MSTLLLDAAGTAHVETGETQRSTHGLVRFAVETDGDVVLSVGPALGLVHRGMEKLAERHTFEEVPVLLDRMDHLAAPHMETVYAISLERLAEIDVPAKARWIRTLMMEMARFTSHMLWLSSWARDAGVMRVSERALRQHRAVAGLMHAISGRPTVFGCIRPGGVTADLPAGIRATAAEILGSVDGPLDEMERLLSRSGVFDRRSCGAGGLDLPGALALGVTGPCLRAFGTPDDVRRTRAYEAYSHVEVGVPVGETGSCRDRCLVRIEEARWSARIILQVLEGMPDGAHAAKVESGLCPPAGEVYSAVESPRGELGMHLVSDGSTSPYRLRLRSPSFFNLGAASAALAGVPLDAAPLVLGSFDLVAGEVER